MSNNKPKQHELLLNPLVGLIPIFVLLFVENFLGLTIALYASIFSYTVVLLYYFFIKAQVYYLILLVNLNLFFLFFLLFSNDVLLISKPYSSLYSSFLVIATIIISFILKPFLFAFFDKNFVGHAKQMESNLREYYRASIFVVCIVAIRALLFVFSLFIATDIQKLQVVSSRLEIDLLLVFIVYQSVRIMKIRKKLLVEEFWPILNESGVVVGKVTRIVTLTPSINQEIHPVVRVHFLHNGSLLLFKNENTIENPDSMWDCAINEHVIFGETMDQTVARGAMEKYGIAGFKPHFLLKHIVNLPLEKQYIMLYYSNEVKDAKLLNSVNAQVKYWPYWQIEENLGKGIFPEAFEIEYDYLKNTVIMAEKFSKNAM